MIGKRLFLVLAAGALLLLQFADCMSAMTPDHAKYEMLRFDALHASES